MRNRFFYCYSPALNDYLIDRGLRYQGVGINENSGDKFWQYERCRMLDEAITDWQNNNPNKNRS